MKTLDAAARQLVGNPRLEATSPEVRTVDPLGTGGVCFVRSPAFHLIVSARQLAAREWQLAACLPAAVPMSRGIVSLPSVVVADLICDLALNL